MADNKVQDIMQQLEDGIKATLDGEKYKDFLKVQSSFHSYSYNNTMLIFIQKPQASRVAGYKSWQKLGRQVLKGEKGITILAPSPYKIESLVNKKDPKTGEVMIDSASGKPVQEKVVKKGLSFQPVKVFDVSQTEGKELPSLCSELAGDSMNAEKIIGAIKSISAVPVTEQPITNGAKGFYSRSENLIALKQGMSLDQTAKTLVHEYAHSLLHNTEAAALMDSATKEVQAESVAFIVSNHFGLDTSQYSFEYLAAWSTDKELKEMKASFDLIQKTAHKIIEDMDAVLQQQKAPELSAADRVIAQYSGEYPAIAHISEDTAKAIESLNADHGIKLTIAALKETHQQLGKRLEVAGQDVDTLKLFQQLDGIMDDLKRAQLSDKQATAKEQVMEETVVAKVNIIER